MNYPTDSSVIEFKNRRSRPNGNGSVSGRLDQYWPQLIGQFLRRISPLAQDRWRKPDIRVSKSPTELGIMVVGLKNGSSFEVYIDDMRLGSFVTNDHGQLKLGSISISELRSHIRADRTPTLFCRRTDTSRSRWHLFKLAEL